MYKVPKVPPFIARASKAGELAGVKGIGAAGVKAAIRWINEHQYGSSIEYSNKYCDKGKRVEPEGIKFVAKVYDLGFIQKNETRFTDEYFSGEPDIVLRESIDDVKCVWSHDTFPRFNKECSNPLYPDQLQVYMHGFNKPESRLHYLLIDAPEQVIMREYYSKVRELELEQREDIYEDLYEEVRSKMVFSHLPDHMRKRTFEYKRDRSRITFLTDRVLEVRKIQTQLSKGVLF